MPLEKPPGWFTDHVSGMMIQISTCLDDITNEMSHLVAGIIFAQDEAMEANKKLKKQIVQRPIPTK